jgi:hypothetical protein
MKTRPLFLRTAAPLVWLCATCPLSAQTSQPTTTSRPAANYSDPAFGFELNLPAGWDYDRTRFQQFKNSIGLLRGRGPEGRRGLQIIVFRSFPMKPFEDWIVDFGKASAELMSSARVEWETWKLPPRAGTILTYSTKLGAGTTRSLGLCVPFDANTVWVLIYSGQVFVDADAAEIRREFDDLAASLRVPYDPAAAERLAPAFERGKALLDQLHADAAKVPFDAAEHVYEMTVAGKSVGYLQRQIAHEEYVYSSPSAKKRYAKDGLRVRERAWRFLNDGTIWYTRVDLFSSFDGQSELIEHQQTQLPPADAQPPEVFSKTDAVIREADVLFSSYTTSHDRELPEPGKPISVGPVYLDLVWVRLLPVLLRGAGEELHALAVYNFESRALLSHTIQPLGEQKLPGYDGPAYAFEVREGFIGHASILHCDKSGALLRLEAGDVTLTLAARDEIERKFGRRRDEARARFQLPAE